MMDAKIGQYLSGIVAFLVLAAPAWGIGQQPELSGGADVVPDAMQGIGVDEKLDRSLNLELMFEDENGKTVRLGDYFDGERPVILQLGYFGCPMLCTLVSKGIVQSLKELDLNMGDEFEVVTVSIDTGETPDLAYAKKQSSIKEYGRPEDAAGWHFLVGHKGAIRELTESVGFRYKYIESARQFSHPAVIIILTPDGRVSRYLYGVKYPAKTLRLSLVEASEGKIGSALDQLILTCFHYDASKGRYAPAAMGVMRLGGGLTVLGLAIVLWWLFRRERRGASVSGSSVAS